MRHILQPYVNIYLEINDTCNYTWGFRDIMDDVIYHTREVFHSTSEHPPRSELKNESIAEFVFLTNFEVLGYLMKHDFRVYITSQTHPYSKRKSGLKLSKCYAN